MPIVLFSLTSLSLTMGARWDLAIPLDNWIGLWLLRGSRLQKKTTRSRPDFTGEVTKGCVCGGGGAKMKGPSQSQAVD